MVPSDFQLPLMITADGAATDEELKGLLCSVYVDGGFTDASVAEQIFAGPAVRARGTLITARDPSDGSLLGMVVLVPPDGASRQVAQGAEAEVHLLAVAPSARRQGVGRALVENVVALAAACQCGQLVLSTQESMHAAHAVYERAGFERTPERDWTRAGRRFLTYRLAGT
jgi:ribosomal protein S18 acetylase RimI-like enzyme